MLASERKAFSFRQTHFFLRRPALVLRLQKGVTCTYSHVYTAIGVKTKDNGELIRHIHSKVALPDTSIKARIAGPYLKEEIQHNSSKPNTDHATFAFAPSYRGQPAHHPMQYVWTNAAATTNQAAYETFTWQQDGN